MTFQFKVNLEDLIGSANEMIGHGEHLAASHVSADGRIAGAEPGWAGKSAAAMSNRAAIWSSRSAALVTRIGDHATGMHTSATCFATNEEHNGEMLRAVYPGHDGMTG